MNVTKTEHTPEEFAAIFRNCAKMIAKLDARNAQQCAAEFERQAALIAPNPVQMELELGKVA